MIVLGIFIVILITFSFVFIVSGFVRFTNDYSFSKENFDDVTYKVLFSIGFILISFLVASAIIFPLLLI